MRKYFVCHGCGHEFSIDEAVNHPEPECHRLAVCPRCLSDDLTEDSEEETGAELLDSLQTAAHDFHKGNKTADRHFWDAFEKLADWIEEIESQKGKEEK